MNRKETTLFLSHLLESDRLGGVGKYWAKEVTLDYGKTELTEEGIKSKTRRIDYLQFKPQNQLSVDGIEKGTFICYEVKSCKEDYLSGYGKNFIAEQNYLVMTMSTYKDLMLLGEINKLAHNIGIMVPLLRTKKYKDTRLTDEYDNPIQITSVEDYPNWYLEVLRPSYKVGRTKSITELLFCMVRSGH